MLNFTIYFLGSQKCSPQSFLHNDSYEQDRHFGANYSTSTGECCIREAIYNGGPVVATFEVYLDFPKSIKQGVNVDWVYEHGKKKIQVF